MENIPANIEPEFIHAETIPNEEPKPKKEIKVTSVIGALFILGFAVGSLLSNNKPKQEQQKPI